MKRIKGHTGEKCRDSATPLTCLLSGLALLCSLMLTGCKSGTPAPRLPPAHAAAYRTAAQAAQMSQSQNWSAALEAWKRAALQFALMNDQTNVTVAWHQMGEAELHLGNSVESKKHLERAAGLNQSLGRREQWWLNQIALLQVEAQAGEEALLSSRFEKLTELSKEIQDPKTLGLFNNELGLWQQKKGSFPDAEKAFHEAKRNFEKAKSETGMATVDANLARLQAAQKNYSGAIETWKTALSQFERLGDAPGIASALAGLGQTFLEQGQNLIAAEDYLRRAARNFDTLRADQSRQRAMELLAQALQAQGKNDEAQAIRSKMSAKTTK